MILVSDFGSLLNFLASLAITTAFVTLVVVAIGRDSRAWPLMPLLAVYLLFVAFDVPAALRALAERAPEDVMPSARTLVAAAMIFLFAAVLNRAWRRLAAAQAENDELRRRLLEQGEGA